MQNRYQTRVTNDGRDVVVDTMTRRVDNPSFMLLVYVAQNSDDAAHVASQMNREVVQIHCAAQHCVEPTGLAATPVEGASNSPASGSR